MRALSARRDDAHDAALVRPLALEADFAVAGRDDDEGFEVRLAHRMVDGVLVDYTMVVASPKRFPVDFMRAARALEIAVATTEVRPQERTCHAA